jgi:hypothetical protein
MIDKFKRNHKDYNIDVTAIVPKGIKLETFKNKIINTLKEVNSEDQILNFKN